MCSDSPADVELHVGVEEGYDGSSGCPPPTHPGADEALLFGVAHHLDEARVQAVGLVHKVPQLLLELI